MSPSLPVVPSNRTLGSRKTRASGFAWLPVTSGIIALGAGALTGGMGWFVGGAVAALSAGAGALLWKNHKKQRNFIATKLFEDRALRVYREHRGTQITKEEVVRDHRLHPDEAEQVLAWLVSHDLLQTDWDELEGPIIYTRMGTAADVPSPPPLESGVRGPGKSMVRHHHQSQVGAHGGWSSGERAPGIAGALSLIVPGTGQFYSGRPGRGIAFMIGTIMAWPTIFGGPIFHILSAMDAARVARIENERDAELR